MRSSRRTTLVKDGSFCRGGDHRSETSGHVRVRVENDGIYARVAVQDDGIGMTPEEKDHAFDEFFRAKNEYTVQVLGTGLGLTVVKRLVEMHQGRITVQTAPGRGSKFTVRLPIMPPTGDNPQ